MNDNMLQNCPWFPTVWKSHDFQKLSPYSGGVSRDLFVHSTKKSQSCCGHAERLISHWKMCFCPLFALQIHPGASQIFSLGYCIQEGIWPMYGPHKCLVRAASIRDENRRRVAKLDVCCSSNLYFSTIYYLQAFAFRAEVSENGAM